jgi:4-hydroxy-4-methyl-2-oxoglutarate aldolase
VSGPLSTAPIDELRRLDSCAVSNAIETFGVRLRNEGFTDSSIRCMFEDLPPVVGHAVTARIRCSTPPPVGHTYSDRTDWWNYILTIPAPRMVVVQDVDDRPGLGAFAGEVHANILRALGCVGYLTNGAVRDLPAVRQAGLQAFAGGTSPSHAFVHVVDFGNSVRVAGLQISSGELLFGDRHGVVSIPREVASLVPPVVADMREKERSVLECCRSPDFSVERLRSMVTGWE